MTNLISGKEALIALANGEDVEARHKQTGMGWNNAMTLNLFSFHSSIFEFRLKPRTVNLSGIEVPSPFEPKEFEDCYMLTDLYKHGYTMTSWKYCKQVPAWRTEDEVKQVVAALRQIFGGV